MLAEVDRLLHLRHIVDRVLKVVQQFQKPIRALIGQAGQERLEREMPSHVVTCQSVERFLVASGERLENGPHDLHVLLRHLPPSHGFEGFRFS